MYPTKDTKLLPKTRLSCSKRRLNDERNCLLSFISFKWRGGFWWILEVYKATHVNQFVFENKIYLPPRFGLRLHSRSIFTI